MVFHVYRHYKLALHAYLFRFDVNMIQRSVLEKPLFCSDQSRRGVLLYWFGFDRKLQYIVRLVTEVISDQLSALYASSSLSRRPLDTVRDDVMRHTVLNVRPERWVVFRFIY